MTFGADIVIVVFVVLLILLVILGVKQVPQGYNHTVERFGRYSKTITPGLAFIVPLIDRIGRRMNMMEQFVDVPSQEVITRDNATVTVDGVAFYQVLDAPRASYEIFDLDNAILNITMTNIRTVMGSMDLDQLLSQRDEINTRLLKVVDAATEPWGVKITRIEIKDINPPRDLVDAMARQMKAERDKRASILEAEGERQSEILQAEGEKQALVLAAEGRREAAFRDAEARERLAEAEAKATQLVSEAVKAGSIQAVNYFVADKYIGALKELAAAPNQKVMLLPMEATALLGALGGIGEIARESFGPRDDGGGGAAADGPRPAQPSSPAGQSPSSTASGPVAPSAGAAARPGPPSGPWGTG
ncbi:SPFH domain-containing protein [Microbaculum marinum]|uniref:Protein QmcA n=1 Tax=Microbaculum marinum TaxID=1764581 RepID=A0AAW9RY31_9HYPH